MTSNLPLSVEWRSDGLYLLDQTRLPLEVVIERQDSLEQVRESIRALRVRGAPAIGIAAAYGLLVDLNAIDGPDLPGFRAAIRQRIERLASARPTAVNLRWALERMGAAIAGDGIGTVAAARAVLLREAQAIHAEDRAICAGIGRHGAELIRDGARVLTHCNAGALAVSELGTALAPVYTAHRRGTTLHVYVDETRPLLQGSRLTAWELTQAGVPCTLLCDNMAASLMAEGRVDLVIVGCDRVAANGDVANKIGTLGVAIIARHFGVPFYVACPSSTLDLATPDGAAIEIEHRDADEVRSLAGRPTTVPGMAAYNPAFDVTPAALVTGIITERGLLTPPYPARLRGLKASLQA